MGDGGRDECGPYPGFLAFHRGLWATADAMNAVPTSDSLLTISKESAYNVLIENKIFTVIPHCKFGKHYLNPVLLRKVYCR
jgi:hypothetical protein